MDYRVYVIANPSARIYIGLSNDPLRRLDDHNSGRSRWTRGRGPWTLEWTSRPMPLGDARQLENLLKRQKGGDGLSTLLRTYASPGS